MSVPRQRAGGRRSRSRSDGSVANPESTRRRSRDAQISCLFQLPKPVLADIAVGDGIEQYPVQFPMAGALGNSAAFPRRRWPAPGRSGRGAGRRSASCDRRGRPDARLSRGRLPPASGGCLGSFTFLGLRGFLLTLALGATGKALRGGVIVVDGFHQVTGRAFGHPLVLLLHQPIEYVELGFDQRRPGGCCTRSAAVVLVTPRLTSSVDQARWLRLGLRRGGLLRGDKGRGWRVSRIVHCPRSMRL